jgi:hypothetical protein
MSDVGKITSLVTTGPRPPAQKRQNGRATGYEGGLAAAPRCASLSNSFVRPGHASLRIEKTLGILFVGVFHSQLPQARAFGRCDVRHMHLWTQFAKIACDFNGEDLTTNLGGQEFESLRARHSE